MKLNDEFIQEYKKLEDAARQLNTDIYNIERDNMTEKIVKNYNYVD